MRRGWARVADRAGLCLFTRWNFDLGRVAMSFVDLQTQTRLQRCIWPTLRASQERPRHNLATLASCRPSRSSVLKVVTAGGQSSLEHDLHAHHARATSLDILSGHRGRGLQRGRQRG